jgi:UDP-glucose 4-epimerase
VHVSDLARAHVLALDALASDPPPAAVYNAGTGRGASVREVIESCRRVTGRAIPWIAAPRFSGDPPTLVADPSRLRADLGWRPSYSDLEGIVASAWRWHLGHPDGYRD